MPLIQALLDCVARYNGMCECMYVLLTQFTKLKGPAI